MASSFLLQRNLDPHDTQVFASLVPGNPVLSSGLWELLHKLGTYKSMQYTHTCKNNKQMSL